MRGRVLVTGAGGFIGHHLVTYLKQRDYWVRGVDIKAPEYSASDADEFKVLDLREKADCLCASRGVTEVYALAADMGGMGFIHRHHAKILHDNALIDLNTIEAARVNGAVRYFFPSSACVYPGRLQADAHSVPLREEDAFPADPPDAYGWEKLVVERLCAHYAQDYGMATRVARLHNIFGPYGTWAGGREKAPAAICRKVAVAKLTGSMQVEVWGDGEQSRSFCFIDDCLEGIFRLMHSDYASPLNIGQDRTVTVNELVAMVCAIADVRVTVRHVPGPEGVRGRNSDNSRLKAALNWKPSVSLEQGLGLTYRWVEEQVKQALEGGIASAQALAISAY